MSQDFRVKQDVVEQFFSISVLKMPSQKPKQQERDASYRWNPYASFLRISAYFSVNSNVIVLKRIHTSDSSYAEGLAGFRLEFLLKYQAPFHQGLFRDRYCFNVDRLEDQFSYLKNHFPSNPPSVRPLASMFALYLDQLLCLLQSYALRLEVSSPSCFQ